MKLACRTQLFPCHLRKNTNQHTQRLQALLCPAPLWLACRRPCYKRGGGGVNVEQHSGMRCRANSIQSGNRSYRRQFKIFDSGSQKYKKQIVSSKVIFFPRHCPFRVSFCLITTKNLRVIRKLNFLKCKTFKFSSWVELLTF